MGNTLCKPVINPPIQNVEQPKDIEPLLTEEAIKILVINEPEKVVIKEEVVSEATVTEPPVIKEEIVSESIVTEPIIEEPVIKEEPVISEATVEVESRVDTLVEEKLSLITPPDDLKEDELVTPMKKKRGRKKKGEQ